MYMICNPLNMGRQKSRLLYERLENEPGNAFSAFCAYRDMHPIERSLALVEAELGVSVKEWSRVYDWSNRVLAWDDYKDRSVRKAEIDAEQDVRESLLGSIAHAAALAEHQLELYTVAAMQNDKKNGLPIADLEEARRLMDSCVKCSALIFGRPTEIIQNKKEDDLDLSNMTVEEMKTLRALQNKAKAE